MLEVEIQPFLTALDITYQLWRIQKCSNEIHKWLTTDSPAVKCKRLRSDFGEALFTELAGKKETINRTHAKTRIGLHIGRTLRMWSSNADVVNKLRDNV